MKWILLVLTLLLPNSLHAQDVALSEQILTKCRIKAANTAVEINPAYRIQTVGIPRFEKTFESTDDVGKKIFGLMYKGRMAFLVGDMKGLQHFSCSFISYDKLTWIFSWAGLGPTE